MDGRGERGVMSMYIWNGLMRDIFYLHDESLISTKTVPALL